MDIELVDVELVKLALESHPVRRQWKLEAATGSVQRVGLCCSNCTTALEGWVSQGGRKRTAG